MISKYKVVSIIYGGEGKTYADKLYKTIEEVSKKKRYPVKAKCVMEKILTDELLGQVVNLFKDSEFCVIFLTQDDIVMCEGEEKRRVRQNVVLEIGMALIELGRERCIFLSDFDYNSNNFDSATDMSSLEILKFNPSDIDSTIELVINKILCDSRKSIRSRIETEEIPRYNDLFKLSTYYIDYRNLFLVNDSQANVVSYEYYKKILEAWYEECKSLYYFDERCMYLLERLCFLPLFDCVDYVDEFMEQVGELIVEYKKRDIDYWNGTKLLDEVKKLIEGIISYSTVKKKGNLESGKAYRQILAAYPVELEIENDLNPLIQLVYYDYLGLIKLKLSKYEKADENLKEAGRAFERALGYSQYVDMSLHIWKGFITYNKARTYMELNMFDDAEDVYKEAIRIRKQWLKIDCLNEKVKNALSLEYFLAEISEIDLQVRSGTIDSSDLIIKYDQIEKEMEQFIDKTESADPLARIRRIIDERRSENV